MTEQEWRKVFSNRILNRMGQRDMTQAELARKSGLHPAAISNYILRKRTAKIDAVLNIAKALGCTVDELVQVDEIVVFEKKKK